MSEKIKSKDKLNSRSTDFVKAFTTKLTTVYELELSSAKRLLQNWPPSKPIPFRDQEEFKQKLARAREIIPERRERLEVVKRFPGLIDEMITEQREVTIEQFLATELIALEEENLEYYRDHLFDAKGNFLQGYSRGIEKTGKLVAIFKGGQIALKLTFGKKDEKTGKIIPTEESTLGVLLPASLLRK
jgi:hypothetical protein